MWRLFILLAYFKLSKGNLRPLFEKSLKVIVIPEDTSSGTEIGDLKVLTKNFEAGDEFGISASGEGRFRVDSSLGKLYLESQLDREIKTIHNFDCFVWDIYEGQKREAKLIVTVFVTDVNDNYPQFTGATIFQVKENVNVNTTVFTLAATDRDFGENGKVEFSFGEQVDHFTITKSGEVSVIKTLDFETKSLYQLLVKAQDKSEDNPLSTTQTITVKVIDVADMTPVFQQKTYSIEVPEDKDIGSSLIKVTAVDGDKMVNHSINYFIVQGTRVLINPTTGLVILADNLDRETESVFIFSVKAFEVSDPDSFSFVEVSILILDVNDHRPSFDYTIYDVRVAENTPQGSVVQTQFKVTDKDVLEVNRQFEFSIISEDGDFEIEKDGYLIVNTELDFETKTEYFLQVTAKETLTEERFSSSATVRVLVINTNDNVPAFKQERYSFEVLENNEMGHMVDFVKAEDADIGVFGEVVYSVVSIHAQSFSVNASGAVFATVKLDYETVQQYNVIVRASDKGTPAHSSEVLVVIKTLDMNDNPPTFVNLPNKIHVDENTHNVHIFTILTEDLDSDANSVAVLIISNVTSESAHFSINSGELLLVKAFDAETITRLTLTFTAENGGLNATGVLTVVINDINDNTPQFERRLYVKGVFESTPLDTLLLNLTATDADVSSDRLRYTIAVDSVFRVDEFGSLYLAAVLDRETTHEYNLTVAVDDQKGRNSSCQVVITVLDVNDEGPVFTKEEYVGWINETSEIGTSVLQVTANDADVGNNSIVLYSLQSDKFWINSSSGEVFVEAHLDWESQPYHNLVVEAKDQGVPPKYTKTAVLINVIDENDNSPIFNYPNYTFAVSENLPRNSFVGFLEATDRDSSIPPNTNGLLYFHILHGNIDDTFIIDRDLGKIETNKTLDRENISNYNLTILVQDEGTPSLSSTAEVLVEVRDMNDRAPLFTNQTYVLQLNENMTFPSAILTVFATDEDVGVNSNIQYFLSGDVHSKFSLSLDGLLALTASLDYEVVTQHQLTITANDGGSPTLSTSVPVYVIIDDVNDNTPIISNLPGQVSVFEASQPMSVVYEVLVSDLDSGENSRLFYTLNHQQFAINYTTGTIYLMGELNLDVVSTYDLSVGVHDNGSPPLSTYSHLIVTVRDSNTHAPAVDNLPTVLHISEHTPQGAQIFAINATDKDEGVNALLKYTLTSDNDFFAIDLSTGMVTTTGKLDRETEPVHVLTINITDSGKTLLWTSSQLTIHLTDENDNHPVIHPDPSLHPQVYQLPISEAIEVGSCLIDINATDADFNNKLTYSVLEDIVRINANTGEVKLAVALDRETRNSGEFTVVVSDAGNLSTQVQVSILVQDVNDNSPVFSQPVYIASLTEGASIGTTVVSVEAIDEDLAFNGLVHYNITAGNQQGWFEISEKGTISVAEQLGGDFIYNLTVTAIDSGNMTGQVSLNSTAAVQIYISDINNNNPVFSEEYYTANIKENLPNNSLVTTVNATDEDREENGRITYSIAGGNEEFRIDNSTGRVHVKGSIDREERRQYDLIIQASDNGFPSPRKTSVPLTIFILDVNDNPPLFTQNQYTATIYENQDKRTELLFSIPLAYTDADSLDDDNRYLITDGSDLFDIHTDSGQVYSKTSFDRETIDTYNISLRVFDATGHFDTAQLLVNVLDVNDRFPVFGEDVYTLHVNESSDIGDIFAVNATDGDVGMNEQITYTLVGGGGRFIINPNTGVLRLVSFLDREITSSYNFTVIATDKGTPPLSSPTVVYVYITDALDTPPYFQQFNANINVQEHTQIGTIILNTTAIDEDVNDKLTYSIVGSEIFDINNKTGSVYIRNDLDREVSPTYTLIINAVDSAGLSTVNPFVLSVIVDDVNDRAPQFETQQCSSEVSEETPDGVIIITVTASDLDFGENAQLTYSMSDNVKSFLEISPEQGFVRKRGDVSSMNFTIIVSDHGQPELSTSIDCSITVIDVNNNSPKFNETNYEMSVSENATYGYVFGRVFATEEDKGTNAQIEYFLVGGEGKFGVNRTTGELRVLVALDREQQAIYTLTISARDKGVPPKQGITVVTITVTDINDAYPFFANDAYVFELRENNVIGQYVGHVRAEDADAGDNANISYEINGEGCLFGILNNGTIFSKTSIDREEIPVVNIVVKAYDHGAPSLKTFTSVKILILDENDNPPYFSSDYNVTVPEDTEIGKQIVKVKAEDNDVGVNAQLTYSLVKGNYSQYFSLEGSNGILRVVKPLDRELVHLVTLSVQACDKGEKARSATTQVFIMIQDVNDNVPIFQVQSYEFFIPENSSLKSTVGHVFATDSDVTTVFNAVYYALNTDEAFIVTKNGTLVLTSLLDRENISTYELTVHAFNLEGGNTTMSNEAKVLIMISDVNDNPPLFPVDCCTMFVVESTSEGVIGSIQATDLDTGVNAHISYRLLQTVPETENFTLDAETGVLSLLTKLDRERASQVWLLVEAKDHGWTPLDSSFWLNITVGDVNDNEPRVLDVQIPVTNENAPPGTFIVQFKGMDVDEGRNSEIEFSMLSSTTELFLNQSGALFTKQPLDYERTPVYKVQIKVTDQGSPRLSSIHVFFIPVGNINDNSPQFTKTVSSGEVGENQPIGTYVTQVQASDPDNDVIYYYITDGNNNEEFAISKTDGVITTNKVLDREERRNYYLKLEANNSQIQKRRKRNTHTVKKRDAPDFSLVIEIEIADSNDNQPHFVREVFTAGVTEDHATGTSILQILAMDADTGADSILHYVISDRNEANAFTMDELTGQISSNHKFTEMAGELFEMVVMVMDNNAIEPYANDTACVKIFVLTDSQQVYIIMSADFQRVKSNISEFKRKLEKATGMLVNIHSVETTQSSNQQNHQQTEIKIHMVDPLTNEIIHKDTVLMLIDDNYEKLEDFFRKWNVTKYDGKAEPVKGNDGSAQNELLIVVVIIVVVMLLLFLCFVLVVVRWRRRSRRTLKAATTSAFENDAVLVNQVHRATLTLDSLPSAFAYQENSPTVRFHDNFEIPEESPQLFKKETIHRNNAFTSFKGEYSIETADNDEASLYLDPDDTHVSEDDVTSLKKNETNFSLLDAVNQQAFDRVSLPTSDEGSLSRRHLHKRRDDVDELDSNASVIDDVINVPLYVRSQQSTLERPSKKPPTFASFSQPSPVSIEPVYARPIKIIKHPADDNTHDDVESPSLGFANENVSPEHFPDVQVTSL